MQFSSIMPTTSSPLSSDVLVNSMIKLEQHQPMSTSPNDSILNPLLQPLHLHQHQHPPLQLLSHQHPLLLAHSASDGVLGSDDDCKVKIELDDLFPTMSGWSDDANSIAASVAGFLPSHLTVSVPPPSTFTLMSTTTSLTSPPIISLNSVIANCSTAASSVVKTVKVPTLSHSMSVPADMETALIKQQLILPQIPASSSSHLNLCHLRPQVSVAASFAAAAGLRIAIPPSPLGAQAADTTTCTGMTTPSPGARSSIASPASASSTTKKIVFTAKGKQHAKEQNQKMTGRQT
jgi:hypothetical protein